MSAWGEATNCSWQLTPCNLVWLTPVTWCKYFFSSRRRPREKKQQMKRVRLMQVPSRKRESQRKKVWSESWFCGAHVTSFVACFITEFLKLKEGGDTKCKFKGSSRGYGAVDHDGTSRWDFLLNGRDNCILYVNKKNTYKHATRTLTGNLCFILSVSAQFMSASQLFTFN